jgi:hypothetical protein
MVLISFVFAIFFILAFAADRLPLIKLIQKISALSKMSLKTISTEAIDDTEKQKLLLANSAGIFKLSAKLAGLVILVLTVGYTLALAGDLLGIVKTPVLFAYLETVPGAVISVLAFCSYFLLKKIYVRARL